MSGRTAVQALRRGPAGLSVKNTGCRCRPAMLEDLAAGTASASGASPARQMQVALVGRVHVVAHVREAVQCGDAPRAGRPRSGRGHTWRLSAAGPC
jgi:hypothetical protein